MAENFAASIKLEIDNLLGKNKIFVHPFYLVTPILFLIVFHNIYPDFITNSAQIVSDFLSRHALKELLHYYIKLLLVIENTVKLTITLWFLYRLFILMTTFVVIDQKIIVVWNKGKKHIIKRNEVSGITVDMASLFYTNVWIHIRSGMIIKLPYMTPARYAKKIMP